MNRDKTKIRIFGSIDQNSGGEVTNFSTARKINQKYADLLFNEVLALSADGGIEILGVIFATSPELTFQANIKAINKNVQKKLTFWALRDLSIKGRALALNNLALSKIWYRASVIPITTNGNGNIQQRNIHQDAYSKKLLADLENTIMSFLWKHPTKRLVKAPVIYLPLNMGGIGLIDLGKQANAIRAKQINEAISDGPNPLPSQIFARHRLVKPLNLTSTSGRIRLFQPYTGHLENYRVETAIMGASFVNSNQNYESLAQIAQRHRDLYIDRNKLPSCKQVYKKLLEPSIITLAGNNKWIQALGISPCWENTWTTLNSNKEKEIFWKTRHFVLNGVDAIDSQNQFQLEGGGLATVRGKCPTCLLTSRTNPQDDTHIHTLYLCPFVQGIWQKIGLILNRIQHPRIPSSTNKKHLIIGVEGLDQKSTIANTIIVAMLSEFWKMRISAKYDNTIPSALQSYLTIIYKVKSAIRNHFLIAKNSAKIDQFTRNVLVPQLFSVNSLGNDINFHF